ncbi:MULTISPECIES: carbohydrate-binding protein [unclassified Streptomyces]|uniref:carbohydrate-binding protein n=1 Tax=unclassified Streptomyces TaxID=2593676 RepID=UPI001F048E4F|nr:MULTISPECIES: carbohydrate-binding protein [unclassified Streptomyces]MCH0561983.1 carbohydrate-binding protein [Streptomyces sp. MUM 2J]MCH0567988.1 carbohydrate-binding protein [Streptomyces sp. MUM 136J]
MTPGNNGSGTPEDDDPFGYLYADGQAKGAQPPSSGYGYPNAVSRVRTVGERQYGQQPPSAPPGQQPAPPHGQVPPQQGGYGRPHPHYAAPETFPGGAPSGPQQQSGHPGGSGRDRGPNTKGLLIGAVAVVAAVVIGISVAMMNGDSGGNPGGAQAAPTQSQAQTSDSSPSASSSAEPDAPLPTIAAKALRLGGSAALASDVQGAQSDGGIYVGNLDQVGSSVTWTVNGIPQDGVYTLFARFSATGEDQSMTLTVNGKEFGSKLNLGNFTHAADGDFAKGWTQTYAWPTLAKGTNTISLSCADGDKCNVLLDQFWLKSGQVTR